MRTKDELKSHLEIINRARHTGQRLAAQAREAYKGRATEPRRETMVDPIPDDVLTGWLNWLEEHEPDQIDRDGVQQAEKICSLRVVGTSGGVVMRLLSTEGKEVDLALNAICAVDLARAILRMGAMIGWDDERLNMLIAPRHKTDA